MYTDNNKYMNLLVYGVVFLSVAFHKVIIIIYLFDTQKGILARIPIEIFYGY